MRKLVAIAAAALVSATAFVVVQPGVQAQPYGQGGYGPGYGMMGPGYGQGYGPGMMGPGYGPGMMGGGYGPGGMMGPGMMGGGYGYGPGGMMGGYGPGYYGRQGNLNLSTDDVKSYLERMLAIRGNSRLKLGEVKENDANTITADIVTKDKEGVVERLVVDRRTGFYHPEEN